MLAGPLRGLIALSALGDQAFDFPPLLLSAKGDGPLFPEIRTVPLLHFLERLEVVLGFAAKSFLSPLNYTCKLLDMPTDKRT